MSNPLPISIKSPSHGPQIDIDESAKARIAHEFFKHHEHIGTTTFSANRNYQFTHENNEYVIEFPMDLIRYKNNKNNFVYSLQSERELGQGAYGYIAEVEGKLYHSEDKMIYIKPGDLKAGYNILMLSIAGDIHTLNSSDMDELIHLTKEKTPILIKDEAGNVVVLGRHLNQWRLTRLNKENFNEIEFPPIGEPRDSQVKSMNSDQFSEEIQNELSIAHTRRNKVVKEIAYNSSTVEQFSINESDIGRATGNKGTKETTLSRDTGDINKHAHIIMDTAPGRSLYEIIELKHNFSHEERCLLTANLLRALKKYHDYGYLHRDIKPGNIMVDITNNMRVQLLDHGLARKLDTPDNHSAGTILYMSPEMIAEPDKADIRSDIYSIGRVLKELWGDTELEQEIKDGQDKLVMKRKNQYRNYLINNTPSPALTLNNNTSNSTIIPELVRGLTMVNPEERTNLEDAINILAQTGLTESRVKVYDLEKRSEKNSLKKDPLQDFIKQNIARVIEEQQPPHITLEKLQNIFKAIIGNDNRKTTRAQLNKIDIITDAYISYLKKLPVKTMKEPELTSIKKQLGRAQSDPGGISNFNPNKLDANPLFSSKSKSAGAAEADVLNKIKAKQKTSDSKREQVKRNLGMY